MAKGSPVGPLLRAQIFAAKGQPREAAAAYAEALARNPRLARRPAPARPAEPPDRPDRRGPPPGQVLLDADPDEPTGLAALLVEARALASQPGTPAQVQANRARAVEKLAAAIKARPDFADAYYLTADIHMMGGDRARAVAALKAALKANPDDANALALGHPDPGRAPGQGPARPPQADLDEARALASASAEADAKGGRIAGRLQRLLPGRPARARPSPGPRRPPPSSTRPTPGSTSATSC